MSVTNSTGLRTLKDAYQYDYWLKAMKTEIDALAKK